MALHACLIVLMLLATVLTPLLGTVPLRGWRWDRHCWWLLGLLSVGMPLAAGHHFARILLPGVGAMFSAISLAGLDAMLRAEREGAAAPALWWRRLARAFAGAGFWVMLALAHFAVGAKGAGRFLNSTENPARLAFWLAGLLATAIVVALLHALGSADDRTAACASSPGRGARGAGRARFYPCAGAFVLLGALAAALVIPWARMHVVGPDILGYLGFDGFVGYPDGAGVFLPDRVVAKSLLASLASVTLLLWGFQALWARLRKADD